MQVIDRRLQHAPDGALVHEERHRPEQTTLYRLVQQHAATFFAQAEEAAGVDLQQFVKDEFDAFLEYGILAHGCLRLRCGDCGHDKLVVFSCRRRGSCSWCGARRMAQTAADLVDHVIPHVSVRQWVHSLPIPLRLLLAALPKLVAPALQVVHHVITRRLLGQVGPKADEADSGAVRLIQRFGSGANLNTHLHCLVLDGVYRRGKDGAPAVVDVFAPTAEALRTVLHKLINRTLKLLTRRGVLVEEEGSTCMAEHYGDSDDARALRPLQAAACTYGIAFGPRAGLKVLTLQGVMPTEKGFLQDLCADNDGFSLHAAVRCGAEVRQALEQLCRDITRPALANGRVRRNASGQAVPKLKTPWRDGTRHWVLSALEFMQRMAALVQRPRLHRIRFHGVLASNAKLRAMVMPQEPEEGAETVKPTECEADCAHHRPVLLSWARLLKRVFDLDLEHCPNCGNELKVIAAILEQPVIEKILTHLGLEARVPPRGPAVLLKAPAQAAGMKQADMADPQAAQRATGYLLGAISLLGQKKRPRTFIDQSAGDWPSVFVSAGQCGLEVELASALLAQLTDARFAAIGRD